MLLPLLASAVLAASPSPEAAAAPAPAPGVTAPVATPLSAPPPTTLAAPAPAPPTRPPSIDSLLKSQGANQTTDTDEDAGSARPQGPVPYSELDGKAYDSALRSSAAAARAAAGPLDGGWTLADADGRRMYRFQFMDRGYGYSLAEGAWRDLDGGPRLQGSGFVDQVNFSKDELILRFHEADSSDEVLITVKPARTGTWEGLLLRRGSFTQVVFKRD